MALKQILTNINDTLIDLGILPNGTPVNLGSNPKRLRTTPPSIFWVPDKSKAGGPNVSVSEATQAALTASGGFVPRVLRTRLLSVECYLWGGDASETDDYTATELLLDAVLTACQTVMTGQYQYAGEKWINPGTEAATLGHRCIAYFAFNLPMNEVTKIGVAQSVEIKTITPTNEIGPLPPGGSTVIV